MAHTKGGAKGEAFASKFAGGDAKRLLAFKVHTSIRTRKGDPLTAEELAEKFNVSVEDMHEALDYLIQQSKIESMERADDSTVYIKFGGTTDGMELLS